MKTSSQDDRGNTKKWMGLRYLVPWFLLAILMVDLAFRFVPPEHVYFRAWEAAITFAAGDGSFTSNFHYDNNRSYGDLSNLGNLPRFRQYHREVFTTDPFGFRNPPSAVTGEVPAALVVGDSYAVGCGVSDGDTLSEQLMSRLSGRRVYNGASAQPSWKLTRELIQRLHMRGGLVIWEVSEREPLPKSVGAEASQSPGAAPIPAGGSEVYGILRDMMRWTDGHLTYSPLSTLLTRGYRRAENGVWLPNPPEKRVLIGRLRNGDKMLFLDSEVDKFYRTRDDTGTYLAEVSDLVRGTGNDLLVLLVPDKYGVYYPLLRETGASPPEGAASLDRLEKDLHRIGIPVVNLMTLLKSQAAEGLQKREYNYAIDDTHWNRLGIQTAATEVLRAWSSRLASEDNDAMERNASTALRNFRGEDQIK